MGVFVGRFSWRQLVSCSGKDLIVRRSEFCFNFTVFKAIRLANFTKATIKFAFINVTLHNLIVSTVFQINWPSLQITLVLGLLLLFFFFYYYFFAVKFSVRLFNDGPKMTFKVLNS